MRTNFSLIALAPLLQLVTGSCNADNCLRALRATQTPGRLESAQSFCATYTQQVDAAATTAIPSFAVNACIGDLPSRVSSACSCIAAPTSSSVPSSSSVVEGACATASKLAAATPTISAQIVYDCLNSVPLHKAEAIEFVDAIKPYLEWQSDTAYLKDPPADYFYPGYDLFGKLASIRSNLENDVYAGEYEFQEDIYQLFAPAHDGHFVMYPDLLTKVFQWGRKLSLVSISSDGTEIPNIYVYEDVTSSPSTASVVKLINGIDASTYVADFAYIAAYNQDADAAYNSMFYEKAFEALGTSTGYFSGGGRVRYIYPGNSTTFSFENGTVVTLENTAVVKTSLDGVTDGESFYQKFCTGPDAIEEESKPAAASSGPVGYPTPVVTTSDGIVSGYYLDGEGFEDVAVISLLAFESESVLEFQGTAQTFFADAVRDGKTKLVVDLSGNGGGYILLGYDLFRQLFPKIIQEDYSRFRENEQFLSIAQVISNAIPANYSPDTATYLQIEEYETFFNYRYDLNLTLQPFLTFEDKFGPHVYKGDNYTNLVRWNLTDPLTTSNSTYGLGTDVTGYGSRANFTQPFAAENIILLYDGICASTCDLFSEFMRLQGGVKSIAMGGRPSTTPIQGVGGVKGAQSFGWSDIYAYAQVAYEQATPEQQAIIGKLTDLPINRSTSNSVNLRDNILPPNLNDGLPAQFVTEEADCRLYYTLDMILDVTKLWEGAATAAWGGGKCVAGSLPKPYVERKVKRQPSKREAKRLRPVLFNRDAEPFKDEAWRARHGRKVIE